MLVFGQAYLAADQQGLDIQSWALWQHGRSLLIMRAQVPRSRVFFLEALPTSSSIRGVSTRLMLACWVYADGYMLYSA
ncbi:hypothetical protein WJX77_005260 [Trebouxia sp. C0004]